ncbi:4-hydroxythreonine-4-phosphate dehydrogenase PdxA, partial [Salibacterium salarium]
MTLPIIGITMGDGAGVGPEIVVKALQEKDIFHTCHPVVIGDVPRLRQAVEICGNKMEQVYEIDDPKEAVFEPGRINCIQVGHFPDDLPFGELSYEAGKHAYLYVEKAVELAKNRTIDAICTAPLNKEAMQGAGYHFPGHTEILAELTETKEYSMMLSAPNLKVIHLTTHVGLKDAIEAITPERTYNVVRLAHDTLQSAG